ncbi:unnamed protein product [Ixodes pacificus]
MIRVLYFQVSYHRFPGDAEIKKKWIAAIKRDEGPLFQVSKSTKVCSFHFLHTDFFTNVASGHRLLRESAVPSVFPFRKTKPPRKPPRQRTASSAQKSKKSKEQHAPADTDSQPQMEEECPELSSTPDENQLPLQEVSAGNENLPQRRTSAGHCECEKIISELEAQLAATKDSESKVRAELDSSERQLAAQATELSLARSELTSAQTKVVNLCDRLKAKSQELNMLRDELVSAQRCLEKLKGDYAPFGIEKFQHSNKDIQFYTGLPNYGSFVDLLEFLDPGEGGKNIIRHHSSHQHEDYRGRPQKVSVSNQLFMVLVKIHLGVFHQHLGHLFSVSVSTVSRIFSVWVDFMYLQLTELPLWLSRRAIDEAMPLSFLEKYPSTRVLLDATEVRCEVPSSFVTQSSVYSYYKSTHTLKALIGVSPNGLITFVFELFTGSTSDRECVVRSGFLEQEFCVGDSIMADKGFCIDDLVEEIGVGLNIPPFLRCDQFTAEQTQETQDIAALWIPVERRIQRIKCFHIFDRPIPTSLAPLANQIWAICAILSNLQSPLIQESEAS